MPDFLDGLDQDIHTALIAQLRNLWTHTSTALEGNALTLDETAFVIDEGLTVSGKPLKDHQEVIGHARAIDLVYRLVQRNTPIVEQDLFELHTAVQSELVIDIMKPIGAWKQEPNGTNAIDAQGKQVFIDYAAPRDVPALMQAWLQLLNENIRATNGPESALAAYVELHVSFVRIHPFFDGNGRMARLVANLPVLRSGSPPIVIPKENRREYINLLAAYELPPAPRRQTSLCCHNRNCSPHFARSARKRGKQRWNWWSGLSANKVNAPLQRKISYATCATKDPATGCDCGHGIAAKNDTGIWTGSRAQTTQRRHSGPPICGCVVDPKSGHCTSQSSFSVFAAASPTIENWRMSIVSKWRDVHFSRKPFKQSFERPTYTRCLATSSVTNKSHRSHIGACFELAQQRDQ